MYLQEILEVAIGLVFMWLIISIAAMQTQEWIAGWFSWRAKDLENAIQKMLTDDKLAEELYNHPLISSLTKKVKRETKKNKPLPSYIPANKFALALFDIVIKAGTEASPIQKAFANLNSQFEAIKNPEQRKLAEADWKALLEMAKRVATIQLSADAVDSVKAQAQAFAGKYPNLKPAVDLTLPQIDIYYQKLLTEQRNSPSIAQEKELTLRQLRLGLLAMDCLYPKFKDTMRPLLTGVEEYITEKESALALARANAEKWFDDSMARLSGWYKRNAQFMAFLIGSVLALALNVDSINLTTSLWREPTLRQAIIAQANTYFQQPEATPVPGIANEGLATSTPTPTTVTPSQAIADLQQQLTVLNIPFGWDTAAFDTGGKGCYLVPFVENTVWGIPTQDAAGVPICKHISNLPVDATGWLAKIAGLLITGAAAAQGAPFWFDVLKKLINVRSTGPKPEEKAVG